MTGMGKAIREEPFRVVLVDDNPADAEIFRIALAQEDANIEVTHFIAGNEILDYFGVGDRTTCECKHCDLVLLDLNLPAISGFEILQRMRNEARFQSMPIVIMSGSSDPGEIARCARLGATTYIQKPSRLTEIFAVGHQIVQMLRARG
ncbi:MAG: response regulator containing a CheY-like receiver domain and an DNA-binding domain protein [Candidatus Solibacter sp.]|jgi:CheY-like chemotaxis protein|nr:response regulator containing a CheY-like receiver domain and an DNA-binding domain protein [Candidatus Solibacter sp.]